MVRVISAHHFKSQDVSTVQEPSCSATAGDLLLLASPLHQIEVRDLVNTDKESHTFPTVDLVKEMVHSPIGRYLATLETREEDFTFVRIYLNWWSPEAASQPMRARIAGRVTPASTNEEIHLEMIELGLKQAVTSIDVCPSTGNLILVSGCTLMIHKYTLVSNTQSKSKFVDFQECFNIRLSYCPASVRIVEDTIACLDQFQVHVFKIKMVDGSDEQQMRSLSTYSFSSESESSMDPFSDKLLSFYSSGPTSVQHPSIANITARRRTDSSSERELGTGHIRRHPGHLTLGACGSDTEDEGSAGDSTVDVIPVPLVERAEKEVGCISTPRILEQQLGPCPTPPHMSVTVTWAGGGAGNVVASPITLLYTKIIEEERQHDCLKLLRMSPVYWREFRIKRDNKGEAGAGGVTSSGAPHNPLQSLMFSHLMSVSLMFTSVHEGYLYHIPGHVRRQGKGIGVTKIATYPFTCPVLDLVLEPSLLHALTETGLETYTLKSGYHTVREAELVDDKYNACPPTSTPLCLIGLRPFMDVRSLLLAHSRLVLVTEPQGTASDDLWTVYSLHLPSHLDLYRDMLAVADMNVAAPHGFLQLLCEAHIIVRTWLHRLTWLRVMAPTGVMVTQEEVTEVTRSFEESCIKLAEHYIASRRSKEYRLAIPYFRMSKLPLIDVLNRLNIETPVPAGTLRLIEELVVDSSTNESIMNAEVADKIIDFLGERSLDNLVKLVILSPSLRNFKTKQSLDYIESDLRRMGDDFTVKAEYAVAAVLVGGIGDWLSMVSPVELSETVLKHYHLLIETSSLNSLTSSPPSQTFSEFALSLRDSVPVIFVEVCVSLVEARLVSLGLMLGLFLQSFMAAVTSPGGQDSAGVFQLFLETYFVELLAVAGDSRRVVLEADQQQALVTLVRSYLASLLHPIPGPSLDESMMSSGPEELFGSRFEYLDHLPPFNCGDDVRQEEVTLLKLQSLLCSSLADDNSKETVLAYLDQNSFAYDVSLRLLCQSPTRNTVKLLTSQCPGAVSFYCKHVGPANGELWTLALEALVTEKQGKEAYGARDALLEAMARSFSPEELETLLPERTEEFSHYLAECRRLHQAARLQSMIVATGHTLLETLAL